MGLHLAALAALAGVDEVFSEGVVQLASRLRHRAANEAARAERARKREAFAAAVDEVGRRPKSETEQIKSETEQIKNEAEQIKKEAEQIEKETEQLRQENKRLAGLNSRMDALLRNADSSSQTPPATDSN
jgi:chromosome segregation ATPase